MFRLGLGLRRAGRIGRARGQRRFLNADGRVDLALLIAAVPYTVYGLSGHPLGLHLRSLGWTGGSGAITRVRFGYVAGDPSRPDRALDLAHGPDVGEPPHGPEQELSAIRGLVLGYGPNEMRDSYFRRGNFHRDWHLERLSQAPRRLVAIHVAGRAVDVHLASWDEPQMVVVARLALDGRQMLAASLNLPRVQLLAALKTVAPLQHDADALAEHQRDHDEAGRELLGAS